MVLEGTELDSDLIYYFLYFLLSVGTPNNGTVL